LKIGGDVVEAQKSAEIVSKKTYKRPSVQVYGTLSQMTANSNDGVAHLSDGATTGHTRT
jgi:hypothetical protein